MRSNALHTAAKRFVLTGLAAIVCTFATSGAIAGGTEERSMTVRFAELDLSKQAGVEVLYRRIKSAAWTVCGGRDPIARINIAKSQCYKTAVANAVTQVNAPLLTALHTEKTKTRLASK